MRVENFEDLEIWKDARAFNTGNLSSDKRPEIFKRFWIAGSNPASSSINNVKYRRGFRTRRQSRIYSISLCRQGVVRGSPLSALCRPRSILCNAKSLRRAGDIFQAPLNYDQQFHCLLKTQRNERGEAHSAKTLRNGLNGWNTPNDLN